MSGKRVALPLLTAGVAAAAAYAAYGVGRRTRAPLPTVAALDLARYAGIWHEIAHLPSWFQRRCAGPAQATYALRADGRLQVHNRCRTMRGTPLEVDGVGEPVSALHPGRLRVSFAPDWLRALGLGWGDYWIIALADDYRWSLVGTPDRQYLWILARNRTLDLVTLQQLSAMALALGFPVGALQFPGMPPQLQAQLRPD